MNNERDIVLHKVLTEQFERLSKAMNSLRYAYERAMNIGVKDNYGEDELTIFDALTGRFIRASDLLMVGVWGTFDKIEREEKGSFLDRIYRAEQRGIISSARDFKDIRDLRNRIVHEYSISDAQKIFAEVVRLSPLLLDAEQTAVKYRDGNLMK